MVSVVRQPNQPEGFTGTSSARVVNWMVGEAIINVLRVIARPQCIFRMRSTIDSCATAVSTHISAALDATINFVGFLSPFRIYNGMFPLLIVLVVKLATL